MTSANLFPFAFIGECALLVVFAFMIFGPWRRGRQKPGDAHRASSDKVNAFQITVPFADPEIEVPKEAQALWNQLTPREKQVAQLAAQRKSNAEIAQALNLTERTVHNYLYTIYDKFEIHSRIELRKLLYPEDDPNR